MRSPVRGLVVLGCLIAGGCSTPVPEALEPDGTFDEGTFDESLGFACGTADLCSGSTNGSTPVYSALYRIGTTDLTRGELLQTFTSDRAGAAQQVRLQLRRLRRFTPPDGTFTPHLFVDLFETAGAGSAARVGGVLSHGSAVLPVTGPLDEVTVTLPGSPAILAGHTYALQITTDVRAPSGSVGFLLFGVAATRGPDYAGGSAFRRGERRAARTADFDGTTEFRSAGAQDILFALDLQDAASCDPNPCFPGVTCTDAVAPLTGFTCGACPSGYVGDGQSCVEFDACSPNPCFSGVTCTDSPAPSTGFSCGACPEGYSGDGETCTELDACSPNPCFPGVTCTDAPAPSTGYTCDACPVGYVGDGESCTEFDACSPNPCFSGVTCTDAPAPSLGFSCDACPSGYVGDGETCTEFDACSPNPCFSGVTCTDSPAPSTGFSCGACPAGYSGDGVTCARQQVSRGSAHACELQGNGTVWCWGSNETGQLGDGTSGGARGTRAQVGTSNDWTWVTAGGNFSCGIKAGGALWCWGNNGNGELGQGTSGGIVASPVRVGVASDWATVTAGYSHVCATTVGHALWCWGYQGDGALGLGDGDLHPVPTQVGTGSTWASVSLSYEHTCGVGTDGSLWCWGNNSTGQLGVVIQTGPSDADCAGFGFNSNACVANGCGYRQFPSVPPSTRCQACEARSQSACGDLPGQYGGCRWNPDQNTCQFVGFAGECGPNLAYDPGFDCCVNPSEPFCCVDPESPFSCPGGGPGGGGGGGASPMSPVQVDAATDWRQVSTAFSHSCAVKTDGSLYCWGENNFGAFGNGTGTESPTPVRIGTANDWESVAIGTQFSCATKTDGTLWCSGRNFEGHLGTHDGIDSTVFVQVGTEGGWSSVSASSSGTGEDGVCALRAGVSYCWGNNTHGQAGVGHTGTKLAPTVQVSPATGLTDVVTSATITCLRTAAGGVQCAGDNAEGALGPNVAGPATSFFTAFGSATWAGVSAGSQFLLLTKAEQTLWAIGNNMLGQLGDGSFTSRSTLAQVGALAGWSGAKTRETHACALRGGELWCWGRNMNGQVGDGTTTDRPAPQRVGSASDWVEGFPLKYSTCGVRAGNALWCWGADFHGEMARGSVGTNRTSPIQIAGSWASVSGGDGHLCGLQTNGTLWCWGSNNNGEVGDGSTTNRLVTTQVGSATNWTKVSAGDFHNCALRSDHSLWCWGFNNYGQLGLGTTATATTPQRVGTGTDWADVSASQWGTCARKLDGTAWCWGDNRSGQHGDGTAWRLTPAAVQ